MYPVKVMRSLAPACPLGSAIKMARPELDPDDDEFPMAAAILWVLNLILLLEPVKELRDAAVGKLNATLSRLQLQTSMDVQKLAAAHTPATLAVVLRDWPPEIILDRRTRWSAICLRP
jgi:hypothetical protein